MSTREHIAPAPHEADVFLWFDDHGLAPYWAVANLLFNTVDGGKHEITTARDGERWTTTLTYSKSGIAPRPEDDVNGDVLYEFDLSVEGPYHKSVHYNISPRYENMRGPDGDRLRIPWCGGDGVDVHAEGSNIPLEEYPEHLWTALRELFADCGKRFNPSYFQQPRGDSKIATYEQYVRLRRHYGRKLAYDDGFFLRLTHLLADRDNVQFELSVNNENGEPKRHAADLPPSALAACGRFDRTFGKRVKLYHPKHLRSEASADDPLTHPKLGVAFHKSIHDEAIAWRDREQLTRDLEEWVVNVLRWGEVPYEPDPTAFIADDVFAVEASSRRIEYRSNPLPALETEQERVLERVLASASDTEADVLKTLATDGGKAHYTELAAETGRSTSTVYRALEGLGELVKCDGDGVHRIASEHIRQEVVGLVERLEELGDSVASRVQELFQVELRGVADSALEKWAAKYGVELEGSDLEDATLRFDAVLSTLRSTSAPRLQEVLQEGIEAWHSVGRDPRVFRQLTYQATVDGQRRSETVRRGRRR